MCEQISFVRGWVKTLNRKNVSALKDIKGEAKGEYDLPKK